ncbi:cytochrome c oxidase assembly protein [Aidingimonas lacisalsi]|uniref:cytochrome c oxidase assembly protein n=1 Tax=Aidingimonas lacisalsi TaxID=2604086 RepID=UPI0011D1B48F|nr:cytochrome c oxidase assembly protein [Aidingimonas lacisalsi]
MSWEGWLNALLPYEWSLLAIVFYVGLAVLYWRGAAVYRRQGEAPARWRSCVFWTGLVLGYVVMHTQFDYYAQFMFFMHRIQHLVLHHVAAFLIVLANPWQILAAGFPPGRVKQQLARWLASSPIQYLYRGLQYPPVAGFLFVGLVYLWLIPDVHFRAMLSHPLYLVMNWSMLLDGLLFWWLILDPRPQALRLAWRLVLLWFVTVLQLVVGAYIALSRSELYDIYALCGRAWPIDPQQDQVLGGILTWVPPGMMSALAVLLLIRRVMRNQVSSVAG